MSDRSLTTGIVGSVVCVAALLTSALLPAVSNGSVSWEETLPAIVLFSTGTMVALGLVFCSQARPTRRWLLSIGLLAAWGLVGGAGWLFTNSSGLAFHRSQLEFSEAQVREAQRATDDRDYPIVERKRDWDRERVELNRIGMCIGGTILVFGIEAASGLVVLLRRMRS